MRRGRSDGIARAVRALGVFVIVSAGVGSVASAQAGRGQGERGAPRAALEQRVRERIGHEVKARLELDDAQMRRLGTTNQQFEEQRRQLLADERTARVALREQMARGDSVNQDRVATLLTQLLAVQRKRVELVEQEQRALAEFLTPVQRAKYLVMQDQIRRRMEEMRGGPRRPGQRGRPPGPGAP